MLLVEFDAGDSEKASDERVAERLACDFLSEQ
jgi:hypothetical protein